MSVSYTELRSLIAVEVGGVCIPRPDLTTREQCVFDTIQGSWTGLRLEHLETCARRNTDPNTGSPGVVVVSAGPNRAKSILELIKRGMVNHLIVDDILADELEKASGAAS